MLGWKKIGITRLLSCLVGLLACTILTGSAWAVVTDVDPVLQEILRQPMDGLKLKRMLLSGKTPQELYARRFRARELMIKRRSEYTFDQIKQLLQQNYDIETVQQLRLALSSTDPAIPSDAPTKRWMRVKFRELTDERELLKSVLKKIGVETAELNYMVSVQRVPNDTFFNQLWGLHNIGQSVGNPGSQTSGTVDADIDGPESWDRLVGNIGTRIAVIDTGIDYAHPDLASNMWVNTAEKNGLPGVDDDGNGYIDDVYGYDFINNDSNPFDDHGHGTHVAGIIAARGNNGLGVVGVSWKASLMALKFLDANGSGSSSDAAEAILYAASMGAKIMNNSWGGGGYSQVLYDAINHANSVNALFVAAAGNGGYDQIGDDNDTTPFYPANYDLPNVLSVAAADQNDALASFSNFGSTTVDLSAPGVNIYSTLPGNNYGYLSGTSMATPYVSGAAGLLLSQNSSRHPAALKALLMGKSDALTNQKNKNVAGGRMNVNTSVNCTSSALDMLVLSPGEGFAMITDSVYHDRPPLTIQAQVHACGKKTSYPAKVQALFSNGNTKINLFDDGLHGDIVAGDGIYANAWTPTSAGTVTIAITATVTSGTSKGSISKTRSGTITEDDDDSDGLTNVMEVAIGTDPLQWDTDGDTIPDGIEVAYDGNPTQYNPYPSGSDLNPKVIDTDGDGYSDSDEYDYAGDGINQATLPWTHEKISKPDTRFAASVGVLPDLNHDGVPDLALGQPAGAVNSSGQPGGSVSIYSGSDWSLLYSIIGPLDVVDFGAFVASGGDFNADGINDIVVGTGYSTTTGQYSIFIYSSENGNQISRFNFAVSSPGYLTMAAGGGDLNGDGIPDLLVGLDTLKQVQVVSGADGSIIRQISVSSGVVALAFGGDMDNDGFREIIIGSPSASTNGAILNGAVFVYSGRQENSLLPPLHQVFGQATGDIFGITVSGIEDLNGDGKPDFLVGSPRLLSPLSSGSVYAMSGANGSVIRQLNGFTLFDLFGSTVAPVNLNDDNVPDILISAVRGDRFDNINNFSNNYGDIYIFRGSNGSLAYRFHSSGLGLILDARSAGNLNGDNIEDIVYTYSAGEAQRLLSRP